MSCVVRVNVYVDGHLTGGNLVPIKIEFTDTPCVHPGWVVSGDVHGAERISIGQLPAWQSTQMQLEAMDSVSRACMNREVSNGTSVVLSHRQ